MLLGSFLCLPAPLRGLTQINTLRCDRVVPLCGIEWGFGIRNAETIGVERESNFSLYLSTAFKIWCNIQDLVFPVPGLSPRGVDVSPSSAPLFLELIGCVFAFFFAKQQNRNAFF